VPDINDRSVYFIALAVIGFIVLVILAMRRYKRNRHQRQVNKLIGDLSHQSIRNVFIPDGTDSEAWLETLLLTDGGIIVLDIHDYTGNLFGGVNINEWTQLIGHKSYKFNNPLLELPMRIHAVQALVGEVPVTGRVVFTHRGQFPKGIPEGVLMVDVTYEVLSGFLRPALSKEKLDAAWQAILHVARPE